jgi:hypothetical protein
LHLLGARADSERRQGKPSIGNRNEFKAGFTEGEPKEEIMKSPASILEATTQDRAMATNLEVHRENKSHNQGAGMGKKIALALLALATIALPAAAEQGGNLTSFSDRSGDRVSYIAGDNPSGGDIHTFWLNGTQPVDTDATQTYRSMGSTWALFNSLIGYSDSDGQHDFYVGGTDDHLHQLRWSWSTGSGSDIDWTSLAGGPTAGRPGPYGVNITGFSNIRIQETLQGLQHEVVQHVYYLAGDNHVHHIYASGASKPADEDLFLAANVTGACAFDLRGLTSYTDGSTELVYYIGGGVSGEIGHICELARVPQSYTFRTCLPLPCHSNTTTFWTEQSFDLTVMFNATKATSRSPITGFADANGQHVFYLGTNWHPYEFILSPTGSSSNPDHFDGYPAVNDWLTHIATPVPNSPGNNEVFVFYMDQYQRVNMVNLNSGVSLVLASGGMPYNDWTDTSSSLTSIDNDASGGADVYYIDLHGHVQRIRASVSSAGNFAPYEDLTFTYGGVPAGPLPAADVAIQDQVMAQVPITVGFGSMPFVYFVDVVNSGPGDALNVVLTSQEPVDVTKGGLSAVNAVGQSTQGSCTRTGGYTSNGYWMAGTIQCNLGTIPYGSTARVTITAWSYPSPFFSFFPQWTYGDSLTTTARVSASNSDPNLSNNASTLNMTVR